MAKFRTNHSKQGGRGGTQIIRVTIFAAILAGLLFLLYLWGRNKKAFDPPSGPAVSWDGSNDYFLPSSTTGQLVHHTYYSLSYSEKHEQAEWTAHVLRKEQLEASRVDRYDWFSADSLVASGSATWEDYRGSTFDRGHLVPAADMAFNSTAMRETFLMSNISPQRHRFNGGIWRELEELTREWAKQNEKLYVITGPVLTEPFLGEIGANEVSVPSAFYKVLLDLSEPELKGIGFIIPNEISDEPLMEFAVPIDEVESRTGIDFFPELMTESLEAALEEKTDPERWPVNAKKYRRRIYEWNKQ